MNLFEQGFKISARLDHFIFMPLRVAIRIVQNPFLGPRVEPELSDHDFHPDLRFSKTGALFIQGHTVTPEFESQPELVVEINRKPLTAVLRQNPVDLLPCQFG